MKQEIAEKWVGALESGGYPQGKVSLRQGDSFCCLGVLCELAVQEGIIDPADGTGIIDPADGTGILKSAMSYAGSLYVLPYEVRKWAGLRSEYGVRTRGKVSLSKKNDHGASFKTIAKIIKKEWEEL